MAIEKKIIFWLAIIALIGTVTNFVYFSPILTILVPLIIYIAARERIMRPVAWLYAYLMLFLVSAILYDFKALFDFGFYRRDGNFIISYAPLLVLPLFGFRFDIEKYFRRFYLFALTLYGLLFVWYLANNTLYFFGGQLFGGLFHAQNAVGGFLAILGSLGFAYYWHNRNLKEFLMFLLVFAILFVTYSRGSILGLVLGIPAWYLATRGWNKTLLVMLLIPVLLTAGSLMVGYPFYKSNAGAGYAIDETLLYNPDSETKNANVLLRIFYTFPRAYHAFIHSPVLGTGVGSFDDRPYIFEEVIPLVQYNAQPAKYHTDSHAHHSYLHILAEQGIVGLAVFLGFWVSLFFFLMKVKTQPVLRDFLLIAFFAITFASFTEHRITTPSMMLPFTIALGLFLAHKLPQQRYVLEAVEK